MKKISILALHLGYGGIEKSIATLANILKDNYEVEIACCYKLYDNPVFEIDKKVKIKYLNNELKPNHETLKIALESKNIIRIAKEVFKTIKVLYKRRKSIRKYIKETNSNIIISTRDIFNKWLENIKKSNCIKIGWEHNHHHNNKEYANKITKSAKKLNYLVLVSKDLQNYYENRLKNTNCKCIHIPNAIDELPKKVSTLKEKRLISIGRLSKEKGYYDLLTLYKRLNKKHPDWTLDIIGDGEEKEKLQNYITKTNLDKKITLHGFQNKDYINKMLEKSSIYIMCSYTESFGIVLIEAMSYGLPCVAYTSAEGAKEIIKNRENGYLIENRSQEAMINRISSLINNYDEREKIGKKARESSKKYCKEAIKEKWLNLLEESDIYA